ncbi:unannotated protein [freshwater metagenome]|uniref:Unannotated protein n=1 Tax=freshwater metagenome TaxID=449393 RepID=A0A6J7IZE3_9ZZZZ
MGERRAVGISKAQCRQCTLAVPDHRRAIRPDTGALLQESQCVRGIVDLRIEAGRVVRIHPGQAGAAAPELVETQARNTASRQLIGDVCGRVQLQITRVPVAIGRPAARQHQCHAAGLADRHAKAAVEGDATGLEADLRIERVVG